VVAAEERSGSHQPVTVRSSPQGSLFTRSLRLGRERGGGVCRETQKIGPGVGSPKKLSEKSKKRKKRQERREQKRKTKVGKL